MGHCFLYIFADNLIFKKKKQKIVDCFSKQTYKTKKAIAENYC